jgi:hypothetical protein
LSAIKTIIGRLYSDPEDFGEPLYDLKHLKLQIRAGSIAPLQVTYGLNKQQRIVFVKDILVLS